METYLRLQEQLGIKPPILQRCAYRIFFYSMPDIVINTEKLEANKTEPLLWRNHKGERQGVLVRQSVAGCHHRERSVTCRTLDVHSLWSCKCHCKVCTVLILWVRKLRFCEVCYDLQTWEHVFFPAHSFSSWVLTYLDRTLGLAWRNWSAGCNFSRVFMQDWSLSLL